MILKEIEQLAETQWEGCHGCDENDKMFWINGFVIGYLNARINNLNDQIDIRHKNIAETLINGEVKIK